MSAEPTQTTNTDGWTRWQGQVVQERFVLRRCLGWSEHGAVFLTEDKAKNLAEAAIKFVRADAPQAQPLLVQWQAAVNLSHPHLVQLFEVGRWQSEGQDYLFVVMEYADQTLAEILRRRPLSAEELQELLPPVLEALTFLHRRQLVHGQLKPSNLLAVGDQLKLASDTIRPAGQDHATSTAGDVWSLGATLVEAITARARISREQRFDVASLPAGLPATLVETVRRCLSPSPADRPSIIELRAENKPVPQATVAKAEPSIQKVPPEAATPRPADTASRVAATAQTAPRPSQEVTPPKPAPSVSQEVAAPQAGRTDSREVAAPQTRTDPREAAAPQAARTDSRETVPSQAAVSRVAALALPVLPRELPPLQPIQTASRVTVTFHTVPSTPREAAQAQPAPSSPQEVSAPKPALSISEAVASLADIASRVAAPAHPVLKTSHEAAQPQAAPTASRVAAASPPVPSTTREITPPQAASSASREAASPAHVNSRVAAPTQPAAKTSHEVAQPQPAQTVSRVAAPVQPVLKTSHEVVPPQVARADSRIAPSQAVPSTTREVATNQPATSTSREITPPRPASSTLREITPPGPAASTTREITSPGQAPSTSRGIAPPRPAASTSSGPVPSESAPKRHFLGIAAGALLLVVAVWIGLRSTDDSPAPVQQTSIPAPTSVAPSPPANIAASKPPVSAPVSQPQAQPAPPPTSDAGVLHEVTPTVPQKIQNRIQGRVYVTVRVLVDSAGNVIAVLMDNPGPSKYFARISDEAAREWQFVPADTDGARVWLLRFEYTRDGVAVRTFEQ